MCQWSQTCHVLALTAVVKGHVRAVHGAQRNPHRFRKGRLGHTALAQQHHLDALALRLRDFPAQGRFQLPNLHLRAVDHLFPPESDSQMNHITRSYACLGPRKSFDSISYGAGYEHNVAAELRYGAAKKVPCG